VELNLSLFWVIAFVLVLAWTLERTLIKPLTRVMQEREQAIASARELAESATQRAAAATREFEEKRAEARADIFKQMDKMRQDLLVHREDILQKARIEADAAFKEASTRLSAQTEDARAQLEHDAQALGIAVAEQMLDRKILSN
jgi:F-type H+-transporting ATPase subunit b|tara:strand:- start:795 stop:1226 length:432 start_codon:yes stop_codon:yes gene_type:complete